MNALEVRCPTCAAQPGALCVSTFGLRKVKPKPHGPRVAAAAGSKKSTGPRDTVPGWVRRELRVRSRDRCEATLLEHVCTRRAAVAHHILRRSQGGLNVVDNLLHCCPNGHAAIHANVAEARKVGYLRSRKAAV